MQSDFAPETFWRSGRIRLTQQVSPVPELHLRPEPETRYVVVDQVLAIIKSEHVEKMGFFGNEQYRNM